MAKKQSTKQRAQVKDLPRKEKKLSPEDLKKVKGGTALEDSLSLKRSNKHK